MLRVLKEHLATKDKHFLLAVMLEYYTFIRPGELSGFKVGDIDAKRHAIHVRASISKNGKAEMVGLNTAIVSLMRELGTLRAPKDWYLFSNRLHPAKGGHRAAVYYHTKSNITARNGQTYSTIPFGWWYAVEDIYARFLKNP